MPLFRSSTDRKAREAGIDPERIPPGQYFTDKWPVLHAGSVPQVDLAAWDFRAFGLVKHPLRLSFDELLALGTEERQADIHCVTRWTKLDMPWKGVPRRAVLERVEPLDSARYVIAHADALPIWPPGTSAPSAWSSIRCGCSFPAGTSGRAPSGCGGSSSPTSTGPASGSATAITTTPTRGRRSATASEPGAGGQPAIRRRSSSTAARRWLRATAIAAASQASASRRAPCGTTR